MKHQLALSAVAILLWSALLLATVGLPELDVVLGTSQEPVPSSALPLLFLTASSWAGAWIAVLGSTILSSYRWEAHHIAWLGAVQALFPFLAPVLPICYCLLKRVEA